MAGRHLLGIALAWFETDRVARVFEPLIADWEQEHAALRGPARIGSWLRVYACFAMTFALSLPWQVKQRLPERVTLSGWMAVELFAGIGVIAQFYAFFGGAAPGLTKIIPAALAIALPLSMVPAAVIVSHVGRPVEARTMVLRLALLMMVVLVPLLSWIAPHSNQAWRDVRHPTHHAPMRGGPEFTLTELLSSQPPADASPRHVQQWDATRRDALLERSSVLLMPVTMGLLGLAVSAVSRRWWWLHAMAWWVIAGTLWLLVLDTNWAASHALLVASAVMLHWDGRRRAGPNAERLA